MEYENTSAQGVQGAQGAQEAQWCKHMVESGKHPEKTQLGIFPDKGKVFAEKSKHLELRCSSKERARGGS